MSTWLDSHIKEQTRLNALASDLAAHAAQRGLHISLPNPPEPRRHFGSKANINAAGRFATNIRSRTEFQRGKVTLLLRVLVEHGIAPVSAHLTDADNTAASTQ